MFGGVNLGINFTGLIFRAIILVIYLWGEGVFVFECCIKPDVYDYHVTFVSPNKKNSVYFNPITKVFGEPRSDVGQIS